LTQVCGSILVDCVLVSALVIMAVLDSFSTVTLSQTLRWFI